MIGSSKKIGRFGPRGSGRKIRWPEGRSFFVSINNKSLLLGEGAYVISAGLENFNSTVIFEHNTVGQFEILFPVLTCNMKHLNNGTGSIIIELSLANALSNNFSLTGSDPGDVDCPSSGSTNLEKSGLQTFGHQGDNANLTRLTNKVNTRPSVLPTVCSFSFLSEFYVIFDNAPVNIDPNDIPDVIITEL